MVPAAITVLMIDSASLGTLTSGDRCRYLGLANLLNLFSDIARTHRSLASTIRLYTAYSRLKRGLSHWKGSIGIL